MSAPDELHGRTLGEFVLRERLGSGGFGAVYRCHQLRIGREAVVKVLHQRLLHHEVARQRFLREARLATLLDHPYAAHVYGFGIEEDGLLWIAMERVLGVTLSDWLGAHGPLPLERLVPFFDRIAEVVQAAHERGIVHRDLKPSNVMIIERAGRLLPKLLDLGVAKLIDASLLPDHETHAIQVYALASSAAWQIKRDHGRGPESEIATLSSDSAPAAGTPPPALRLTHDGATIGSPPYIAPEQWSDPVNVGPASDLYALAVLAYEALTGRRPFRGASLDEYAEEHCFAQVPPLGPGFAPELDQVFQRALAKRPGDRWPTALELADALRAASGKPSTIEVPRLDEPLLGKWLADAPAPLAESVAELSRARNPHQARDAVVELGRNLLRYLLAIALVTRSEVSALPALRLVRELARRELGVDERVQLIRLLVRPHSDQRGAHPIPELVELVIPGPDGSDGLDPLLALHVAADHAGTEDTVRARLGHLLEVLTRVLGHARFLLDYPLVMRRGEAAERWTGLCRSRPEVPATLGDLIADHPTLVRRDGAVCAELWPVLQVVQSADGAEPVLFMFDGRGHHGALMISAPAGLTREDAAAWTWIEDHILAEIEARARMSDRIGTAARHWVEQERTSALLWRGDVLAELERWTRHSTAAPLDDVEASFITASRRAARRVAWTRRLAITTFFVLILGIIEYRAELRTRLAAQLASELEHGRQALLHQDNAEAQRHLAAVYQRGDHSPGLAFMLARSLQPRLAELKRLPSASGRMWSAAFSPEGDRLVTTDDTSAQIWDARTGQLLLTLPNGDSVHDAHYTQDGRRLVTAGGGGAVRIWDASTGALLKTLTSDGARLRYGVLALSADGRFVAAIDTVGSLADIWDATTGALLQELRNSALEFPAISFSADSRWLATSGGDDVRVFDTATWTQVLTIPGPRIRAFDFDGSGARIATASARGDVSIWAVPGGARISHLREVGAPLAAVAFSPDGTQLATGGADGSEQIWDAASGALQHELDAMPRNIVAIEWDPSSRLTLAAGASGAVVIDAAVGMPVTTLDGPRGGVRTAHFDRSATRVVGAFLDGTAVLWSAASPYRRWSSPPISDDCGLMTSLEPDRRFVAIGCRDHATRVFDTATDRLLAELPAMGAVPGDFAAAFPAVSADGTRAAIARGNTIEIYALPGRRLLRTIGHSGPVSAIAFDPAEHDLISGAVDGSVQITREDQAPVSLRASGGIDAVALLGDGRALVADAHNHLWIYAQDRRTVLADLALSARVGSLRPSPDARHLVTIPTSTIPSSAGKAGPPVIWDLDHLAPGAVLAGHVGRVFSARWITAHRVLTAGQDGEVRLWDCETGRLRGTFRAGGHLLADATLSPDGSLLVAGGAGGVVWFWDLNGQPLWTLRAHTSYVVGLHFEGSDLVTRGFGGDISRWTIPSADAVIAEAATR